MQKRAQAAMEFLMTYGWALLVVLIAVGALAFFGVLNPARFLPESCMLGPGFACTDFKVSAGANAIDLTITNGLGKNLEEFIITIGKEDANSLDPCGGYIGWVGLNATPGGLIGTIFRDGETKPMTRGFFGNSIFCGPPNPSPICCGSFDPPAAPGTGLVVGTNLCPPHPSFSTTGVDMCVTTPPLTGLQGKKFKRNLIITYRELGSSIYHRIIGQLVTAIEA